MNSKLLEYIKLAFRNIRGNLLRTILTCLIIAFGIMALVGIQTVITSLGNSVAEVFSPFGTNQFTITNRTQSFESDDQKKPNPPISITEARTFKEVMNFPGKVSVNGTFGYSLEIKTQQEKTSPTFSLIGGDEHYLELNSKEIEYGRNFSINELTSGESVAVITPSLKDKLFEDLDWNNVIGQNIIARGRRYQIIGILKESGQGFGGSSSFVLIPLENGVRFFNTETSNYQIKMGVPSAEALQPAMAEAEGVMRLARNLRTIDESNFEIEDPGAANDRLKAVLNNVTMGGLLIGIITLTGAAVGLMNILLVSVTERIREIGVSKAIGATVQSIRLQYFIEGMLISFIGGILGIILGLIAGFAVSKVTKSIFTVPWDWVIIGIVVCLAVGLISSIYPAIKASKLNPIEALRQN